MKLIKSFKENGIAFDIFGKKKKVIKMNRKFDGVLLEKVAQRKDQGKREKGKNIDSSERRNVNWASRGKPITKLLAPLVWGTSKNWHL